MSQCKYPQGEIESCTFVLRNISYFFYKISSSIRAEIYFKQNFSFPVVLTKLSPMSLPEV